MSQVVVSQQHQRRGYREEEEEQIWQQRQGLNAPIELIVNNPISELILGKLSQTLKGYCTVYIVLRSLGQPSLAG